MVRSMWNDDEIPFPNSTETLGRNWNGGSNSDACLDGTSTHFLNLASRKTKPSSWDVFAVGVLISGSIHRDNLVLQFLWYLVLAAYSLAIGLRLVACVLGALSVIFGRTKKGGIRDDQSSEGTG